MTPGEEVRSIELVVNGEARQVAVPERWTLVDTLRGPLGLTGTHAGCEHGICGSCTVLFDGEPVRSCLVLAVQADGHAVETVEGLGTADRPHPAQVAFSQHRALQCGFCTPGFLMVAAWLARQDPAPTDAEVDDAVSANLCRCTGYEGITRAMRSVAGGQQGS